MNRREHCRHAWHQYVQDGAMYEHCKSCNWTRAICPNCDGLSPMLSLDNKIVHCDVCHDKHYVEDLDGAIALIRAAFEQHDGKPSTCMLVVEDQPRRTNGVIDDCCSVCGKATDSRAHREHCRG